jgi:Ca-activated chloride channel family protein
VVVAPGDALPHLDTGHRYRFEGLLGATTVAPVQEMPDACPGCGGQLRHGQALDTAGQAVVEAAEALVLDDPFGIVDAETTVTRVREDRDLVDDWRPMDETPEHVDPPAFVCRDCGRHIDRHELRRHEHGDGEVLEDFVESAAPAAETAAASPETVGMAAGGATDATNFRENVRNGYTPQPEAIADEGLFYDYHFDTGDDATAEAGSGSGSDALFAPRYATGVSDHPITGETEHYLSVGLDSTLAVDDFQRPPLDLVAVLDVSGSMSSPFDRYYYDEHGRRQQVDAGEGNGEGEGEGRDRGETTKLEAATRSLCALTEQLHPEDRLGVVLYDHRAHVAKPLRDVGSTDMRAIRRHVREVTAGGSTNLADGFEAAIDMLQDGGTGEGAGVNSERERRVVFTTDMMPNTGTTGEGALTDLFAEAAEMGIHATFVGMGLDANAELADALSGIRGANHYFVHSADEFERRLGEEFDYVVTPLVYDLELELEGAGWEVAAVHGSPSADPATGALMRVGTLFPSAKSGGEARGGVVLARIERVGGDDGRGGSVERGAGGSLELRASWVERNGDEHVETVAVDVPTAGEHYDHDGVRKAVALARYARELRGWAADVHDRSDRASGVDDWVLPDRRGRHERESVPLVVPDEYGERFATLADYLAGEREALGDDTLDQELELLETLCAEVPGSLRQHTRREGE